MTAKRPATALPWEADMPEPYELRVRAVVDGRGIAKVWLDDAPVPDYNTEQRKNANYIVHAANAYPKLVEALRQTANKYPDFAAGREAAALLQELGEAE